MILTTPRPNPALKLLTGRCRMLLTVFALLNLFVLAAPAAPATKTFDIPAGEAISTLKRVAQQAGIEIMFPADVVSGVTTNAVQGEFTPREAIDRMLAGTVLYVVADEKTAALSVRRSPKAEPAKEAPRAETTKTGDEPVVLSAFEVNDNRVRGYQATNSTSVTRLNTPLVELSKSIQIITRDMLDDLKVTELNDSLYYSSAVSFTSNYSGRVAVRGFENAAAKRNGLGNYGSDETISDTATVERIEIVKGPSSLLYGSSSPGGVVNYETKKPLSYHQDSLKLVVGAWNHQRVELDSAGPVVGDGKQLNYRFIAAYDKSDNFGAYDESERGLLAGSLRWHLSSDTYILAGVEYDRSERTNIRPTGTYPISSSGFDANGNLIEFNTGFILTKEAREWASVYANPRNLHDSEVFRYDVDFSHKFNDEANLFLHYNYIDNNLIGEAFAINGNDGWNQGLPQTAPNYARKDELTLYTAFRNPHRKSHNGTATFNYNFKGEGFESQLIAGWEFYTFDLDQGDYGLKSQFYQKVNFRTGAGYDQLNFANTLAEVLKGVAAGQWNVNDRYVRSQTYNAPYLLLHSYLMDRRLRVVAGIRRDDIKIRQTFRGNGGSLTDPFLLAAPVYTNSDASATTPMLGVSFTPFAENRGFAVYANYSESLVANEIVNPDGSTLPPETGKGLEAGLKFDLNSKFSATLSWFTIDKTNLARGIPNTTPQQWEASGLQRSKGVDMDVFYAVTPDWQIIGNAAFIDAYYVEDRPVLIGTQIANVPKWAWSIWNKYTVSSGPMKGFSIGGGAISRGESLAYGIEYPALRLPQFIRFDLLFGYAAKLGGHEWDFSVKINNVADKIYMDGARGFGEPRSLQTSVTLKF